ncbi:rhomboid family intramembrane serine protease [Pseudobacteriovorax antillogorgiicola]|uniref:Membrane associated serine protease, rhomboid family n=1 Tax=Pseudobacteriovorax antillogorgiicola TaxID=1513793 RepID=A0A1Y6BFD4_9BACT|nr:rhomboid family intramembrane serine protease [Pseudobacteriovorax antillogorgiicola]TCS57467.1 membrane associated rhomboid family serine protease [Pseudobacteriovorax antillogorgiicola]SMF00713.1 Membrane associated serine protease, rhomboid family [Pseudobacteriovorax antillogorgiicola]
MQCPNDKSPLSYFDHIYSCSSCHGSFHKREGLGQSLYHNLGEMFRKRSVEQQKTCPHCQSKMLEIEHQSDELHLDICLSCQGIWFDYGEIPHLERYIKQRLKRPQRYLDVKKRLQESAVQTLYKRYLNTPGDRSDPSKLEILFQILSSLPLERNLRPIKTPVTVFALIAINIMIFALSYNTGLGEVFQSWAFIPGQSPAFPNILYSMFLHGGFLHLLGNMYFLWIMGDNVEDLMGPANFLLIYFLAGFLGFVASEISGPAGVPHVGASGAVAGIMAAYLLLFPKAKFLLRFFLVIVIPISSLFYILFWFGMNVVNFVVFKQAGVAWSAHIVGFIVGFIGTYIFRKRHGIIDQE